jgi:N-6 DNA Methylase
VSKSAKGEKGQYFTPRWVIDMCVKMLNPQEDETVIDTACGSAGFTVHSMFHVWRQILDDLNLPQSHLFTAERKPQRCLDYVGNKVFALDFDEKSVRVSRCLNLIAGDGQTNVLHLNTLDWTKWDETVKQEEWQETYGQGWTKLRKHRADKKQTDYRHFGFDIVMANPPFAGDIKQTDMLAPYEMAQKANRKYESAVGRDLLFIERNLDFLKPGGRMAIVLPQGRFNNIGDERLHRYIMEQCRVLAVVGLHPNSFKPHTNTKTSVLFVQKWNDDASVGALCPRVEDYDVFLASQHIESVNNSGEKVYVKTSDGAFARDSHGHFIVSHDLFNHDGKTQNGVAEAYLDFFRNNLRRTMSEQIVKKVESKNGLDRASIADAIINGKWRTSEALWYFATASEIKTAGRMDAQFFHPKFREIQARLEATGRCTTLSKSLALNVRGRQPQYADMGLPVINSKHVRANRVVLDSENRLAIEKGSPVVIKNGDVLMNGTGVGTIGRTAPYLHAEKALPDNHVTVLRSRTIDPIYLSVFLNSSLGQLQIERHIRGSSGQIEIYPYDIGKIVVWDAPEETQRRIREAILKSFDQERKATDLLERAKRAVEFAIEENEDAALRFLKEAGA